MPFSLNSGILIRSGLAAAGIGYPFAVYVAIGKVPPGAFILVALLLIIGRLAALRGHALARVVLPPLLATIAVTLALAIADAEFAVKAYPVLMSLCFAAAFGMSILRPPSLVEIMARLKTPDLPPEGVRYTRRVSIAWLAFLLLNACLSLATALSGDLELWTLYNGAVSYALIALLIGGELLIRRRVRARPAA